VAIDFNIISHLEQAVRTLLDQSIVHRRRGVDAPYALAETFEGFRL